MYISTYIYLYICIYIYQTPKPKPQTPNPEAAVETVLELDGTRPGKFSRHLILPGVVMGSVSHAGALMRAFAPTLPPEVSSPPPQKNSRSMYYGEHVVGGFVSEGGESAFTTFKTSTSCSRLSIKNSLCQVRVLIDMGVYTRNRSFRVLASSKFSNRFPLVVYPPPYKFYEP